ncbi:MAG TPA: FGGY family carbohydrate kinase [Euzebyales bacterium]|nr:FGGY family carbohydrate kinase [Euzebyales bacterium]
MRVLGIDLGTGSTKAAVVDERGEIRGLGTAPHRVEQPAPGAAEIAPSVWLSSVVTAVGDALAGAGAGRIEAVGLSGQMHGVVCTAADGTPVRPALLWTDTRATAACARYANLPFAVRRNLGNPPAPGMFGPLVATAIEGDPGLRRRIRWAVSPKDWLRLALTGAPATEPSDASATLLWDVSADTWSSAVLDLLDIPAGWLPPVVASESMAGTLTADGGDLLGLPVGTPVAAGAADTAAALHGSGLAAGGAQVSVGTGGQVIVPLSDPTLSDTPVTHRYRRATASGWYAMAAIQNAGLALEWVRDVLHADWAEVHGALDDVAPGADGVTFHGYLTGERTPVLDPHVRAAWQGLALRHGRAALLRAALEGVAFALRDGLEALIDEGIAIDTVHLVGGGTDDPRWRSLLATTLARPLHVRAIAHVSVVGAARLAAAAVGGHVPTADHIADIIVVDPDAATVGPTEAAWRRWRERRPT